MEIEEELYTQHCEDADRLAKAQSESYRAWEKQETPDPDWEALVHTIGRSSLEYAIEKETEMNRAQDTYDRHIIEAQIAGDIEYNPKLLLHATDDYSLWAMQGILDNLKQGNSVVAEALTNELVRHIRTMDEFLLSKGIYHFPEL